MPYIGNPIYQSAFVTDTFSGNGTTTAFTMSVAPAGTTNVLVAISGVLQDPSTYGVVGTTITFSSAPPSGTGNISCRYLGIPVTGVTTTAYRTVTEFTATAGQTTFTPPSYTVGFINVYRNGVLLGSADYTATNGTTVVLASGATSGDLVTVESFLVSSVLNAIPNTAGAVNVGGTLVSGTLPVANGGTGVTTSTGTGAGVHAATPSFTTTIGVGGATPAASGSGITFPATQSASTDANTLDDYEEGSWTPVDASGDGVTFTVNGAYYVKVGRMVTVNTYFNFGATSGGSPVVIGGLPFTVYGGNSYFYGPVRAGGVNSIAACQVNASTTTIYMYPYNSSSVPLVNSQLSSNYVLLSVTYLAVN